MTELSETFKRLQRDPQGGSQHVVHLLEVFLLPLLQRLDEVLDKRLVRTFLQCIVAIIRLRNNPQALWLSELGSYLQGYDGDTCSAAAGTKRVGKLLRSLKWTVGLIDRYLLEQADEEVNRLDQHGQRILCLWDGSVVEKAESEKLEGLCPVLSRKAKRRQRSKRGYVFNWPAVRPVRVMGMQWSAGLIAGMSGLPHLAVTKWWTRHRDFCDETARCRRRVVAPHGEAMGSSAGACRGIVAMPPAIGSRCSGSIAPVLSSVGSKIMCL